MRTFSCTGLGGRPEPLPAAQDRIVHRAPALAERLEPTPAVPADVGGQLGDEGLGGPAAPVPPVEELDLEPAEEALARGVVGRVAPWWTCASPSVRLTLRPSYPSPWAPR